MWVDGWVGCFIRVGGWVVCFIRVGGWMVCFIRVGGLFHIDQYIYKHTWYYMISYKHTWYGVATMSRLLKMIGFFSKEPYQRNDILPKRPMILRSLRIVATPYQHLNINLGSTWVVLWVNIMCVCLYIGLFVYMYVQKLTHTILDSTRQRTATHCNAIWQTPQRTATHSNTLQHCDTLAIHCNTLQYTATHCNVNALQRCSAYWSNYANVYIYICIYISMHMSESWCLNILLPL